MMGDDEIVSISDGLLRDFKSYEKASMLWKDFIHENPCDNLQNLIATMPAPEIDPKSAPATAEDIEKNLVPIIDRQNEMLKNNEKAIEILINQYAALADSYKELKNANKTLTESLNLSKAEIEDNKKDIKKERAKSTLSLIITGLAFLVSGASLVVSIISIAGNVQ